MHCPDHNPFDGHTHLHLGPSPSQGEYDFEYHIIWKSPTMPGEHVLPSPGPAASQLPFSVLLWPRVWRRLRRLLWTALQCHHRSDQVGVVSIFYVTSNLSGILHVHHYFTGVGKFNSAKRSYFNQFLYLRKIFQVWLWSVMLFYDFRLQNLGLKANNLILYIGGNTKGADGVHLMKLCPKW